MPKFEELLKHVEENTVTFKISMISDPKKFVWIRPLKTKDQKLAIIAKDEGEGNPLLNFEHLIDLLDEIIVKQDKSINDMTIPDFVWLLINLRTKSLGDLIDFRVKCKTPKCVGSTKLTFDLVKDLVIIPAPETFKNNVVAMTKDMKFILGELTVDNMHDVLMSGDKETEQAVTMAGILKDVEFEGQLVPDLTLEQKVKLCGETTEEQTKQFEAFGKVNEYGPFIKKKYKCATCGQEHEETFNSFEVINFF